MHRVHGMDRSDVITLVGSTRTQNAYGVWQETKTARDVFCQVDSVTRAEFFEGGRNGLNPEYRFTMFFGDYDGEREVIFKNKPYSCENRRAGTVCRAEGWFQWRHAE